MMNRRGFTLFEVTMAAVLLGAAAVACVRFLGTTVRAGRVQQRRQIALDEAENVMERLFARDWTELATEKLVDLTLGPTAAEALPGATLAVRVDAPTGTPPAKRLVVEIVYGPTAGTKRTVRLVAWKHILPEEGAP